MRIRCYGGELHGQDINWDGRNNFIRAPRRRFIHEDPWKFNPGTPIVYDPLEIETYQIDQWRERCGTGYREMRVALLEGRPLHRHEEHQIQRDIRDEPWKPIREPSILREFDSWFAWCAYKHTKDYSYVREEIGW